MNRSSLASKVWIAAVVGALLAGILGGLAAFAAAHDASGWAVAAVVVQAAAMGGLGLWISRSVASAAAGLAREAQRVTDALASGDYFSRGRPELLAPDCRPAVEAMNGAVERLARAIELGTDGLVRLSKGELPPEVTDADVPELARAINAASAAVAALVDDARAVAAAAGREKFEPRLSGKLQGRFAEVTKELMAGCAKLATRVRPAEAKKDPAQEEALRNVARLTRLTEYQRDELARVHRAIVQLAAGNLSVQLDVGSGDEHTRDARQSFLETAKTLERLRGAVAALVRDTTRLGEAAVAGRLGERADVNAHEGEFRKVVEGVNRTLDAVIAPIQEAAKALEALAQRDLRARVVGTYGGDHARIKNAVNAAATALHDALAQVSEAVEQVSSAATQIAASSQAVASGASEQASSLAETSSSIEEVAGMTKQSADNAQRANHLAGEARSAAGEGTSAVEQMQSAMSRIKASAEGTSQIIRDINDIAFQTNLLALNAAVEAARAGEAGRGFAVVAEEVRSLALRAKEAAQKTEELIRQSVKEAVQGEVTAKQVAGKLTEIAGGISKVTDIISEIAAGAAEQSSGIDQVNRAVSEMDKVTQQNAASAEESSATASELSGQAEELASMVGAFQLERSARRGAAALPPAPPQAHRAPARPASLPPRAAPPTAAAPAHRNGTAKEADKLFPMDDPADVRDF